MKENYWRSEPRNYENKITICVLWTWKAIAVKATKVLNKLREFALQSISFIFTWFFLGEEGDFYLKRGVCLRGRLFQTLDNFRGV